MDRQAIAAKFRQLVEGGLPVEFTYKGRTLIGAGAVVNSKLRFSEWGVQEGYSKSMLVCADDFDGGVPELRDTVIIAGKEYRIIAADPDAAGTGVLMHLGDLHYAD